MKAFVSTNALRTFQIFALLTTFLIGAIACQAQIYVYVRRDATGMVKSVNQHNGRSRASNQADAREGEWEKLIESAAEGYGAVFCVADASKGLRPHYFYAYGKDSQDEAISQARSEAQEFARRYNETPFIMGGWYNRNLYPLED